MKSIRKFTTALFAILLLFAVLNSSATCKIYAVGNQVTNIDIEVVIRDDGSAVVTQHWRGNFNEGTEIYLPINTKDIGISEFSVSDENGPYTLLPKWDTNADFEEKAGKYGKVSTNEGVELCFGITEYGYKEYTFSYVVTDFIKGYRDANGTNFMFINPGMSTFPTAGTIEISMENGAALNDDNANIWAFGFEGQIIFDRGSVIAYTEYNLEGDNSMIVMLELDKNLLNPQKNVTEESFAAVREEAMKDSSYGHGEEEDDILTSILSALLGGALAVFLGSVFYANKVIKENKKFAASVDYFADVPNGGNIEVTHYLARTFDVSSEDRLIIGALMVSMMNKKCLELRETVDTYGNAQPVRELYLLAEPDTLPERRLFYILSAAAYGTGVLQEQALEEYAYYHYEEIQRFLHTTRTNGEEAFTNMGGFLKNSGNRIKHLSDIGKDELAQVIGFKKYLEEHARMAEHDIWEANLWQDYMVYATLFGVSEEVVKQLNILYPERQQIFDTYYDDYMWCYGYGYGMYDSMKRAADEAAAEGSGGSSSNSGGDGYSGGGSGGGSR